MIHAILNGDFSHAVETLLAVSVLILIVLMLRPAISRQFGAGVVYVLWAIPVLRFLLPPIDSPVSLLNADLSALTALGAPAPAQTAAAEVAAPVMADVTISAAEAGAAFVAAEPAPVPAGLAESVDLLAFAVTAGTVIWIAGAMFVAARSLMAHWQFMRTVDREAMPVSAEMQALARDVTRQTKLRRAPRLVTSLISRGPFVTGLLRPVVVMPAWFEDDFSRAEARAALAHEFMHVRRGDLWALQIAELLVAAMWFNPLAYVARNAFRTDQEAACDADVLRRGETSPHAYGATLVKAARLHLPEPVMAGARLPLAHALKERLTRMSYPTPSAQRRMLGFGAALLFGVSALAITASVASAGEPDGDGSYSFRIESDGPLIVSSAEDRQIVMLSDPMAKVLPDPPEPPEVAELQRRIDADVAMLTGPEMMGPIIAWTESEDWEEFAALAEEMASLHGDVVEKTITDENGKRVVRVIRSTGEELTEAEHEALAAKLEAKAAALEAKMAAREAEMDAHERQIESQVTILERRIEANAAEIERIVEARYGGEGFEQRVDAQAEVIEAMVEACEDAELKTGETRIIERADPEGEVFRLACVEGDRSRLKAQETLAAIDAHPGITAAEKAAFNAAASGKRFKSLYVYSSGEAGPAAPMAPLPPLTPIDPVDAVDPVDPVDAVDPLPPLPPLAPVDPVDAADPALCGDDAAASAGADCP